MRYDLDELDRINTAGDRYGHITPGVVAELIAEVRRLREALGAINVIRNSIIGLQTLNWSEHVYPLVAALNAAGVEGMNYPDAREFFGPMLDRCNAAEDDAERYRWAISLEDNVEQLYAAVVSCGPDMPGSINIEIDAHRAKEPK